MNTVHWIKEDGSGPAIYLFLCAGAWFFPSAKWDSTSHSAKDQYHPLLACEKCVWQCRWGTGRCYSFDGCLVGSCGNSAMESRQDLCIVPEASFTMCSLRMVSSKALKGSSKGELVSTDTFQDERSLSQQKCQCLLPLKNIISWCWTCNLVGRVLTQNVRRPHGFISSTTQIEYSGVCL